MLQASTMSDLARAIRESRAKSVYGAKVVPDDVFSKSAEIMDIASRAGENGEIIPIGQLHTWSIVEPEAPLPTKATNIAHFRFDETTGTNAADASRNENDLTVSGATWAAGKWGNCLSFDGTNDTATVTAVSAEPLRNYLYVSCWIKPTSVAGTRPIVKLADRFLLYLDAGQIKCTLTDGVTDYTVSSGLIAVTGSWQFVTVAYIDGQVLVGLDDLVYRGSIALTTYSEEYPAAGKVLTVGSDGSSFFAGLLDELMLDANVRVMDDWPVVNQIASFNDVILWPFVENTGTSVYSTNLLGEVLALSGATWTTGRTRYGTQFNGTSSYGECNPTAETFTGRTLSIEVGIKFPVAAACPIITQAGGLNLAIDGSGNITAALGGVTNPSSVLGTLTVDTDDWYDLVVVYDGSEKQLFVNGQKIGSVPATGTAIMPAVAMHIARDGSTYGNCVIDRIRVYRARLRPWYRNVPLFQPGIHGFTTISEWLTYPN